MGAVFGEYDNWINFKAKNFQKIKAAKAVIAAAKQQEAEKKQAARNEDNDISHLKKAKTSQDTGQTIQNANSISSYYANGQLRASSDIASGNAINSAVGRGFRLHHPAVNL